jgi:N-acyl-D-aspartate/D-glutamate deacylase
LRARELGGRVVALTMPVMPDSNVSLFAFSPLWLIPGWHDVLAVDVPERVQRLKDPAVRAALVEKATYSPDSRPWWARLADFSHYRIGDVYSEQNEPYRNRIIGDIAAERGEDPFTTAMDIMTADDLQTTLWPAAPADSDADWALRRNLWDNPDVLLGGSDAGAHIDNMLGSPYPSRFLGDTLRGRKLVSLERAVQLMTETPAQLFGLRGRGRLAAGYQADVVVLDPERIGAGPPRFCHDMPADSKRLVADSEGIVRVLVNGRETIVEGNPTGDRPGVVLRSGRDTTVAPR